MGRLEQVWEGIETALDLNLGPIKINTVVMRGVNDDEILDFIKLIFLYPVHIRFIECMPIGEADGWAQQSMVPQAEIKAGLRNGLSLNRDEHILGADPPVLSGAGALGSIGFISPITAHFVRPATGCGLPDGKLRPCLNSRWEIDLKHLCGPSASDIELKRLFLEAVRKTAGSYHE